MDRKIDKWDLTVHNKTNGTDWINENIKEENFTEMRKV